MHCDQKLSNDDWCKWEMEAGNIVLGVFHYFDLAL